MITLQTTEIKAVDKETEEELFLLESYGDDATVKIGTRITPANWPEISAKISEALAMMFPGEPKQPTREDDIVRTCKELTGRAVVIEWKDPSHDWPNFYVRAVLGESIKLQGRDMDGIKHAGDMFWVAASEIRSITEAK